MSDYNQSVNIDKAIQLSNTVNELTAQNIELQLKVDKLKQLLLLTDEAVSNVEMNSLTKRQWLEFIKTYPDEGDL